MNNIIVITFEKSSLSYMLSTYKEIIGNLTVTIYYDINQLSIDNFPVGTYLILKNNIFSKTAHSLMVFKH